MSSLYVISAVGRDKPGLVYSVTSTLAALRINIVDVDSKSVRGHFTMFLVVDLSTSEATYEDMVRELEPAEKLFNLGLRVEKYKAGRRRVVKKLMVLTMMGGDQPGLVASVSGLLSAHSVNIEAIKMIARGEYIAMEFKVDTSDIGDVQSFRKILYARAKTLGLDVSLRDYEIFGKPKKIIIFDCDSTIIQQEIIDELAKSANVQEMVAELTDQAMNGKIDFTQALKSRVKLLEGFPVDKLQPLIDSIELTPGAEELISTLRRMGYRVGVISGGFTFFTDHLKERLHLDYVYANELEIKNGIITGRVKGKIIDAHRKSEILKEIAAMEGVSPDEVVAVGDGANDRFMLKDAGLAIAFNPKEILKDYSDGMISTENISGLLYFLGVPEEYSNSAEKGGKE